METTTPVERVGIRLCASTEGVASSHPGAAVSLAVAAEGAGDVRRACCPYILALTGQGEYRRWLGANPGVVGTCLSLEEAWTLAAELMQPPFADEEPGRACCWGA